MTSNEIRCVSPGSVKEGVVRVQVSMNGMDFEISHLVFEYEKRPRLHRIWPVSGPAFGGSKRHVMIYGENFRDTEMISCRFGSKIVPAAFRSDTEIMCRAPPGRPGLVHVEITNNGNDYSTSSLQYLRHYDISISKVFPSKSLHTGNIPVFVVGMNFLNSTDLACRFGSATVRATMVSQNVISCIVPSRVAEHLNVTGVVSFEITNNGMDYTKSGLTFEYVTCRQGTFCPQLEPLSCPNGTFCPVSVENSMYAERRFNFTLCPPGTFQPRSGQTSCAQCPIGFVCPDFGMFAPMPCPAGYVCNKLSTKTATLKCPEGHFL